MLRTGRPADNGGAAASGCSPARSACSLCPARCSAFRAVSPQLPAGIAANRVLHDRPRRTIRGWRAASRSARSSAAPLPLHPGGNPVAFGREVTVAVRLDALNSRLDPGARAAGRGRAGVESAEDRRRWPTTSGFRAATKASPVRRGAERVAGSRCRSATFNAKPKAAIPSSVADRARRARQRRPLAAHVRRRRRADRRCRRLVPRRAQPQRHRRGALFARARPPRPAGRRQAGRPGGLRRDPVPLLGSTPFSLYVCVALSALCGSPKRAVT